MRLLLRSLVQLMLILVLQLLLILLIHRVRTTRVLLLQEYPHNVIHNHEVYALPHPLSELSSLEQVPVLNWTRAFVHVLVQELSVLRYPSHPKHVLLVLELFPLIYQSPYYVAFQLTTSHAARHLLKRVYQSQDVLVRLN